MKEEIIDVTRAIDQIRNSCRSAQACKSTIAFINTELGKLIRKQGVD